VPSRSHGDHAAFARESPKSARSRVRASAAVRFSGDEVDVGDVAGVPPRRQLGQRRIALGTHDHEGAGKAASAESNQLSPPLNFVNVQADAVYLMPGGEDDGFSKDDLFGGGYEHLKPLT
jgi:hypothetical protein